MGNDAMAETDTPTNELTLDCSDIDQHLGKPIESSP